MHRHPIRSAAAIAALAALSAFGLVAMPASAASACAQLEVHNVRPDQGAVRVAAYADAAAYGKMPVVQLELRAEATTLSVPLCDLAGATSIAVTLYQDTNGNGKLDRNLLGIPSEPWGASGKPSAMSAPTWETTAVALDGAPVVVRLSQ